MHYEILMNNKIIYDNILQVMYKDGFSFKARIGRNQLCLNFVELRDAFMPYFNVQNNEIFSCSNCLKKFLENHWYSILKFRRFGSCRSVAPGLKNKMNGQPWSLSSLHVKELHLKRTKRLCLFWIDLPYFDTISVQIFNLIWSNIYFAMIMMDKNSMHNKFIWKYVNMLWKWWWASFKYIKNLKTLLIKYFMSIFRMTWMCCWEHTSQKA